MATSPFPGVWSSYLDFGGNSQFVLDSAGTIWLVSTLTSVGISLYKSTDNGRTFNQVVQLVSPSSSTLPFDPAIEIDSEANLHILGQLSTVSGIELVAYLYNTTTSSLASSITLSTGATSPSDYDLVDYGSGSAFIAAVYTLNGVQSLEYFILSSTNTLSLSGTLTSSITTAGRVGSLSLALITYQLQPLVLFFLGVSTTTYNKFSCSIEIATFSSGIFTPSSTGITVNATYLDKDVTVISSSGGLGMYLTFGSYSQVGALLAGNLSVYEYVYGSTPTVSGFTLYGTSSASYLKPILSHSDSGLVLAYITSDMSQGTMLDGPLSLFDLDPSIWELSPRSDFPYPASAYYLRGTKSAFSTASIWGFIAQSIADGAARFYTGYNSPPVAVISPTTLIAQRGITYEIDASGSYDVNFNTLVYAWSLNDPTSLAEFTASGDGATILVPNAVGPGAVTLTVTVSVTAVDANGNPLHPVVTAELTITVSAVAAPSISVAQTLTAARNSTVTLTPVVINTADSPLTYSWVQSSGTSIPVLTDPTLETLEISTAGALVTGENLYFSLTVSDGVNAPVSQTFVVAVEARATLSDLTTLQRTLRTSSSIASRNINSTWEVARQQGLITAFSKARQGSLIPGIQTTTFVSSKEILCVTGSESYHVLLPNPNDSIVDGVHDASDIVLALAASGNIYAYVPTGLDTDNAFATISVSAYSTFSYETMFATPQFANQRVIAISGSNGCLLLLLKCTDYTVISDLELTLASGLLYGANRVQWVRLSGVESLHSGQVLVGTVDNNGNCFETLISLQTRTVLAVWDATSLQNDVVTTGEIMTTTPDTYCGLPLAPEITNLAANSDHTITISWSQTRNDLVSAYQIQYALDGETFNFLMRVNSGQVLQVKTPVLMPGNTYTFKVQALSLDGASPLSGPSGITI